MQICVGMLHVSCPTNRLWKILYKVFFVALWENKNLSVTAENFLPYAYRAVYNRCLNYYKAELTKENFLTSLAEEWENDTEEEEFPYKKEVRAALRKLPPKCQ